MPGVSVSRSGGPGGLTQIRIRGAEANHVLLLIDGVETANSAGGFDVSRLSPDLIERIEVLRGPQSTLYGAGATAGVINVITKGGLRDTVRFSGAVEGTTAPGGSLTGLLQAGGGRADGSLGFSFIDDAGWDVSGEDGEEDGVRSFTLTTKGTADLTERVRVRGNLLFSDSLSEFDATQFGCGNSDCYVVDAEDFEAESRTALGSVALDIDTLGGALVHTPSFRYAWADSVSRTTSVSDSEASTLGAAYQAAYTFGSAARHTLVGALQFERETFESSFAGGDVKSREQIGYVADYRGDLTDALFVQGGLRFDDNEDFEDFVSWAASASYSIFETGTRLRGSIGRAQTNPTFFEQFGFIPGQFVGNPDLEPERNLGWDIGVDQRFWGDRGEINLTYFNETLQDEITGTGNSVDNLDGESDRQGVELGLFLQPIDSLRLAASYTYLDATEPDGRRELLRPIHAAAASAFYDFLQDRATVGVEVVYNGTNKQVDFGSSLSPQPRVTVDDYVVVDLNAAYRLTERVQVYGGINNLLDADNEDVLGFEGQPLTAFLGLRAVF